MALLFVLMMCVALSTCIVVLEPDHIIEAGKKGTIFGYHFDAKDSKLVIAAPSSMQNSSGFVQLGSGVIIHGPPGRKKDFASVGVAVNKRFIIVGTRYPTSYIDIYKATFPHQLICSLNLTRIPQMYDIAMNENDTIVVTSNYNSVHVFDRKKLSFWQDFFNETYGDYQARTRVTISGNNFAISTYHEIKEHGRSIYFKAFLHLYQFSHGKWRKLQTLFSPGSFCKYFGRPIAMSGKMIALGCWSNDTILVYGLRDKMWVLTGKIHHQTTIYDDLICRFSVQNGLIAASYGNATTVYKSTLTTDNHMTWEKYAVLNAPRYDYQFGLTHVCIDRKLVYTGMIPLGDAKNSKILVHKLPQTTNEGNHFSFQLTNKIPFMITAIILRL